MSWQWLESPMFPDRKGGDLTPPVGRDIFAHELKTPLTVAWLSLELLRDAAQLPDPARQHLDRIEQCLGWLRRLIEDMPAWAGLLTGQITLHRRSVAAEEWVEPAVELVHPLARTMGCRVSLIYQDPVPAVVGDPWCLKQAMASILVAATQSSPQGGAIQVSVGARPGRVIIRVVNRGPHRPTPPGRENTADRPGTPELHLARAVVGLHGGSLVVTNRRGRPVAFTLTLPAT